MDWAAAECRLFVISNELPEFGDASGAIVNRFIVLTLGTSWLGNEDIELETRLRSQLPGILNWALAGLKHLERRGRFAQPKSSTEAIATMAEMASPIRTFIRDRCEQTRVTGCSSTTSMRPTASGPSSMVIQK